MTGVRILAGHWIFFPHNHILNAYGTQQIIGILSLGVKCPEHKANHLFSPKVTNA
jgi:hypothetical protein